MPVSTSVGSDAERALDSVKRWFIAIGLFSALINILMLTGALYMLQIYDRVLSSRSIPTLVALSLLALLAYAVQGYLESVRSRMLVNIGAAYEVALAPAVFNAVSALSLSGFDSAQAIQPTRDVERVRGFLSGLGPTAILDMPFMPVFLAACFILHPWLGWLAVGGSILIVLLTVVAEYITRSETKTAMTLSHERTVMLEASRRNSEAIIAMGFRGAMRNRWLAANAAALAPGAKSSSRTAALGAFAKTFRFILQSAVLGLGAYLATKQEVSPGAIIAASIMMSRALAPIEIAIGHWRNFSAARESHARLKKMLAVGDLGRGKTSLPAPRKTVIVENLIVIPPGADKPIVKGVSFELPAWLGSGRFWTERRRKIDHVAGARQRLAVGERCGASRWSTDQSLPRRRDRQAHWVFAAGRRTARWDRRREYRALRSGRQT